MVTSLFLLCLINVVIIGYIGISKLILTKKISEINDYDFPYGILILVFLSLSINLFFPLKYFSIIVLVFGLISFLYHLKNKKIQMKWLSLFFINFGVLFISYNNDLNYDSMLYHLQTIKYNTNFKVILGLSNLEPRLGMNSSFHTLLGLFNVNIFNQNLIYFFNITIFCFFLNLIFSKNFFSKKNDILIFLSIIFILFYSLIHPWNIGTILNNLGSPEVDMLSMIFFIICFYLFLDLIRVRNEENYNLFLITIFLLISFKLSYLYVAFLAFYIFFNCKILIINRTFIILGICFSLWAMKGVFLTGCMLFPLEYTCFNFSWSLGKENVEDYYNIIKAFNRTLPENTNFGYYLNNTTSYEWLISWFNDYFLTTEFLIISFIIMLFSSLFLFFIKLLKKKKLFDIKKHNIFIIFFFIISLMIWLQSPDIRLGYGLFIIASMLPLANIFHVLKLDKQNLKIFKYSVTFVFALLIFKQINNIYLYKDLPYQKEFNYKNIKKIYDSNNYDVFRPTQGVFCNFFNQFCSYQSLKVKIKEKKGYIIMINNWEG